MNAYFLTINEKGVVGKKMLLTYLEIQVRARNIMMADTQTDYLID